MSHTPLQRQGRTTVDRLMSMAPQALHRLGRRAAGLGAQGLIALIAVGTPIAGLCLAAYVSPILVRAAIGELNVIAAALLWLTLVTWSAAYIYKDHVLPVTLRLCWRIRTWQRALRPQDVAPVRAPISADALDLAFQEEIGLVRSLKGRVD